MLSLRPNRWRQALVVALLCATLVSAVLLAVEAQLAVRGQMRPGNFVKEVAVFDVVLADHGIERTGPDLPLQVAPQARVTVSVLATDASPAENERRPA